MSHVVAQILRDVRHAARAIRRMPGVAAVVVGSLGIGIGVNTAVFSWIDARVRQPLPAVRDSGSFQLIETRGEHGSYPGMSWLEYRDLQERLTTFRDMLAFKIVPFNVGAADWSERTFGQLVSGNYFSALGLTAVTGRLLDLEHAARPGGEPVVVISYNFWQSRFGASSAAVGQTLRVNDRPLTIIGIAPRGFQGTVMGLTFDLWVPATATPFVFEGSRELDNRGDRGYSAIARLQRGAARGDAQTDLDAAMRQLAHDFPDTNRTITADVLRFWQAPRGPQRSLVAALVVLQGVMLLVLLAVTGNTANLMLARASARQREMSVRLALGAGRWRVVSLLLTENLLLAMLGVVVGIAIAFWATEALRAVPMPTPGGMRLSFYTPIDAMSLAFATLLGLGCGLIFGLAPALQLARVDPQPSLRAGASAPGRSRVRDTVMALEVAVALLVLVVGALFLKSFNETRSIDPGFTREGLLVAAYDLRGRNRDVTPADSVDFARRFLDKLRSLPAVDSAALATSVPLDIHGMPSRSFAVEGRARPDGALDQSLTNIVSPGYFKTMRIRIIVGRDFADLRDTTAPPEAVVNEEFVRRYLDAKEPIGRRLETGGRVYSIAGVVATSLYNSFGEPPTPFIYLSYRDRPSSMGEVHLRARAGDESALANDVRRVLREIDPTLPLYNVRTMTEHVETNLVFRRVPARIFVVLGPLLLCLVAVGIYAVVAYTVAQRTAEIGMRLALGATTGRVAAGLIAEALRVIGLGALGGWLVALLITDLLPGGSLDVPVLLGVPMLLFAVATLACWVPARRAGAISPMVVLKQE